MVNTLLGKLFTKIIECKINGWEEKKKKERMGRWVSN